MSENKSWENYRQAFEFLAFILNNSPNADITRQLRDMFSVPEAQISDENMHTASKIIAGYWHEHLETPLEDVERELVVEWTRLFRGAGPDYGPPPPYEGVYRENDGIGTNTILEVNQEYNRHGLSVLKEQNDRSDYLGYELDFIKHMAELAAAAQKQGRTEEEETYMNTIRAFINTHLATWVGDFCRQAEKYTHTDFFKGFLMLLGDVVIETSECLNV